LTKSLRNRHEVGQGDGNGSFSMASHFESTPSKS
jgi:hypothetical protein